MNRVLVSLAANELKVKQRVAVNTEAGWFIGTVKLVKTKYATVLFDDGDTAEVVKTGGAKDFKILPQDTPKSKRAYKATEIRALLQNSSVPSPIPQPKKYNKTDSHKGSSTDLDDKHSRKIQEPEITPLPPRPQPQVPRMRVIGQPSPKAPDTSITHDVESPRTHDVPNESRIEQLRVVYETQIRASTNTAATRRFLLDLWTVFNKEKFGGKLRPIKKFLVIPAQGRFGIRAFWHPKYRILVFTNLVLKANWDKFSEIFGHEMCHQAVTDVDHGGIPKPQANQGHGPEWQAWMHRIGLEPKQYDHSGFSEYMTEEDKKLFGEHAEQVNVGDEVKTNEMSNYALAIVRKKDHYDGFKAARLHPVKNAQVGSFVTLSDGSTEEAPEGVIDVVKGNGEYRITLYTEELRGVQWTVSEHDKERPLFYIRDPKIKYRARARRMAEEARREARRNGLMR